MTIELDRAARGTLPSPLRERWQPLRAGLVDLFYYDREEFWFRDGRLLLRGNNGTGKSKVLALMLPFLLDADLSAHRVEPDADPKKRMEWNLLLGGAFAHTERLGYTWLEFGRLGADGTAHFCTIGAGLKAVAGRGMLPPWFFVTTQRVGAGLELVDHTDTVLTKDRLAAALEGHGTRYDRAGEYRRAVDAALFGLGEQRYGALVDLLVQLRQPQLSKRPSERALSAALTEALPPLDPSLLAVAAESFRSLQEDSEELGGLRDAAEATGRFLGHYRRYARVAARRRAAEPVSAHTRAETLAAQLADAEKQHARAARRAEDARGRIEEHEARLETLRTREAALRDSDAADAARELDAARSALQERESDVARIAAEAASAERARDRLSDRAAQANDALAQAQHRHRDARARAAERARAAGLPGDAADRDAAEARVQSRSRALRGIRTLADAAARAQAAVADARRRLDDIASRADAAAARVDEARRGVAARSAELADAVRTCLDTARELRVDDPDGLLDELDSWCTDPVGRGPVTARLDAVAAAVRAELTASSALLADRRRTLEERRGALAGEIARTESGETAAPRPPHTRTAAARPAGAPLWRVADFAPGVDDDARAGLEAALEASGLLDAWIDPSAGADGARAGEALLAAPPGDARPPALGTPPMADGTLLAVLRPAIDTADAAAAAVTDEAVSAVLAGIGLGPGSGRPVWVDADGRYGAGVLRGAWAKPAAEYIGGGAREAARRGRLAALREESEEAARALEDVAAEEDALAARLQRLARERSALPADDALRGAHHGAAAAEAEQRRLRDEQAGAARAVDEAVAAHEAAAAAFADDAADAGLPTDPAALDRIHETLGDYRVALADLWPAAAAAGTAATAHAQAQEDLARSELARAEVAERLSAAEAAAAHARVRYDTLRETVSADVEELHRRLDELRGELDACREQQRAALADERAALEARGKAEGRRQELAGESYAARSALAAAAERFHRFAGSGLLDAALPDRPDVTGLAGDAGVTPAVECARRAAEALDEVDGGDDAWKRASQKLTDEHKTLEDVLGRQGNTSSLQLTADGTMSVRVTFRGRPTPVGELADSLAAEVAEHERLLTAREREILENHLLGEIATTVQDLIAGAEAHVARMNDELDSRPTSTGMRLRLDWQPREDGPSGLAEAQRTLRRGADGWTAGDRAAVGAFLQDRIHEVRARNAGGTWLEHLREALDYRAWFRFVIKRHQNGRWRSAVGPASGGESALVVSVPLFAAASAHYSSAGDPHAPRLVMLDEAFAGVDDNARAKYLGLLASFDMDVVMTSEREWGCYPEVPGIAIAQLARTDGVEAVLVTRWEWDGARRVRGPEPVRAAAAPPTPAGQDALWGG